MIEAEFLPFAHWEGFCVIVGTSASALMGLQFVVITLIAEFRPSRSDDELDAFATPTIVHFCAVLLVSGIVGAPWHAYGGAGLALTATGLAGIIYGILVTRRAMRQTSYTPVLEDWIWHAALPIAAYSTLLISGVFVARGHGEAVFVVAAVSLLLMFIAIHNAWDTVTYVTLEGKKPGE